MAARGSRVLVLGLALTAVAIIPFGTFIWYSYYSTIQQGEKEIRYFAEAAVSHVDMVLDASETAIGDLIYDSRAGCSDALFAEMRRTVHLARWIESVTLADAGGNTLCSSVGSVGFMPDSPAFEEGRGPGARIRPPAPDRPDGLLTMVHRLDTGDWLYTRMFPQDLLAFSSPLLAPIRDNFIGHLGIELADGAILAELGRLPIDASTLEVAVSSQSYPVVAKAVVSSDWVRKDWKDTALVFGILGFVISVGLVTFLLMFLWIRGRGSGS